MRGHRRIAPELELGQMSSFGCGHDAYLTDEIARMMGEMGSKVPMMIKLDESDVAGPMGIRVRSFIESVNRRRAEERAEAPGCTRSIRSRPV